MKWSNLFFFPLGWKNRVADTVVADKSYFVNYVAASFNKRGPIMSVPVALFMSIFEKNFRTFSFWICGILNFVLDGSFD